jgi:hypothetical protein
MLSGDLESLINELGKGGLNESTIKGRLSLIQEQAQAQEADIAQKKAKLEYADKRITELEVQLHEQEQRERGDRLPDLTEKVLKLLFETEDNDGCAATEDLARVLGIKKNLVQHHCDILYEAEMIQWAGVGAYYIIAKGSAYAVKYLAKD